MPQSSLVAVLAPARDGELVPAAVAGAGGGQHDGIAAVGEDLHRAARRCAGSRIGARPAAWHRARRRRRVTSSARTGTRSRSRGLRSWRSSSAAAMIGSAWKRAPHRAADQRVGDRRRWSCPDDGPCRRARSANSRPRARGSACSRAPRRSRRSRGRRRARERRSSRTAAAGSTMAASAGRIGRDDGVRAEAALQAEAGHAEIRVLVGELQVAGVVGGLRDAPGHAELGAIVDLPRDDEPVGCARAGCRSGARITSDGIRYSNIEPDQEMSAGAAGRPPSRSGPGEPVLGRDVALGDARRSSRAAPRRRAGRSSWGRGGPPWRDSRSKAAGGRRSSRKRKSIDCAMARATSAMRARRSRSARTGSSGARASQCVRDAGSELRLGAAATAATARCGSRRGRPGAERRERALLLVARAGEGVGMRARSRRWLSMVARVALPRPRPRSPPARRRMRRRLGKRDDLRRLLVEPDKRCGRVGAAERLAIAGRPRAPSSAPASAAPGLPSPDSLVQAARAARVRPRQSPTAANAPGRGAGSAIASSQALARAMRWPARLPLSTVETYCGSSGRRSVVSYQL